jgi:TIR domain
MSPRVFISHSSEDKTIADTICQRFEADGIKCWIAPRDTEPGSDLTKTITEGIDACQIFVLVFSKPANESDHVYREVAKAFTSRLKRLQGEELGSTSFACRDELNKKVQSSSSAYLLSALAVADALLDRKEDANREAENAVVMLSVAKNPLDGPCVLANSAVVHAWTGAVEKAFTELEVLTTIPRGVYYGQLKRDPLWDPLRKDPRFDKLLAQLAPKN